MLATLKASLVKDGICIVRKGVLETISCTESYVKVQAWNPELSSLLIAVKVFITG